MSEGIPCFNCAKVAHCRGCPRSKCKQFVSAQITKREIAEILGISERTVGRMLASGKAEKVKELMAGKGIRIVFEKVNEKVMTYRRL